SRNPDCPTCGTERETTRRRSAGVAAPRRVSVPSGGSRSTSRICSAPPSTGATVVTRAVSPAAVSRTAGARSHWPRQGLRIHVAAPPLDPGGPITRSRDSQSASPPRRRHAMSPHTWPTIGGRGFVDRRRAKGATPQSSAGGPVRPRPDAVGSPWRTHPCPPCRAAARPHPNDLALAETITVGVLGGHVEALATTHRRAIAGALHAGVVLVEPPSRGEAQRKLGVEPVDGGIVLDRDECDPRTTNRPLPQTAVEEELARVVVVVARPLEPAVLLEPRVAHAGMHRREAAHLVPDHLGVR